MQVTPAAQARRDQIVAATLTVLAREGYAQTSFKRIVEEAGLSSTRLISYHFDGKEDLLLAVLRTVAERGAAAMSAAMAAETTWPGRLAAYIRANLEFLGGDPDYAPALAEIIHNLRAWRSGPGEDGDIAVRVLAGLLTEGQDAGEFGAFDPVVMAVAIRASIDAVALRLASHPGLDLAHHIDELLAIYRAATERSTR